MVKQCDFKSTVRRNCVFLKNCLIAQPKPPRSNLLMKWLDESCKCGHCLKTRNDNSQPVKQANDSSNEQTDHPEKDGTKNKNIEKENVAFAWISGCLLGTIIGTITLHGMLFGRDKIEELIQTRRSLTEELKRRDLAAFERGYIKPEAVREIVTELEKAESRLNTAVTNLDETGLQALAKEEMWELKRANNDVWSITRELRNSVGRKRLYR
ncbi:MAG: hypothetical protein M1831_000920 [Alyxoria varia]|nr:MAG: hypothetical protein M1831_000920 [Alyxoria varia]